MVLNFEMFRCPGLEDGVVVVVTCKYVTWFPFIKSDETIVILCEDDPFTIITLTQEVDRAVSKEIKGRSDKDSPRLAFIFAFWSITSHPTGLSMSKTKDRPG
jgi:hypothetical protein